MGAAATTSWWCWAPRSSTCPHRPAQSSPRTGPTAAQRSLRAGLSAIDAEYAVLHTVDTPDVGVDVVRRVLDAARSSASGLARARYGERPGHPVVVARRHWPDLLATLSGDEGARPFLGARTDVVAVDCADLASGHDIDVR